MKLTIDTAAIAHRVRRWWFRWFQAPRPGARCCDCGGELTHDERVYYGVTCERCEGIAFRAQQAADGG